MKQIYRPKVKITLNLKNGKQSIVSDDYLYWPYRYGTLPPSQKIKIPISEFNPYELSRFYPLIKNTGRDKRGDFTYFDYLAGNIERAPMWMQKANLEWLYRLMQEPKRLFKRYFYTNTKFIWNAVIRGK